MNDDLINLTRGNLLQFTDNYFLSNLELIWRPLPHTDGIIFSKIQKRVFVFGLGDDLRYRACAMRMLSVAMCYVACSLDVWDVDVKQDHLGILRSEKMYGESGRVSTFL
jgi:hypothetical protein